MPEEKSEPLSEDEIEAIGAHIENYDIALPKVDMISTMELGRVLKSAVAFEKRLFVTVRELQAENKRLKDDIVQWEKVKNKYMHCGQLEKERRGKAEALVKALKHKMTGCRGSYLWETDGLIERRDCRECQEAKELIPAKREKDHDQD